MGMWNTMRQGLLAKAELPLETTILLISGMTLVIAGALLFPVYAGRLPFYENGLHGLLLFFFALQIVMLGRTPFGERPVSAFLMTVGMLVAAVGIVTCFIPEIPNQIARMTLFVFLAPGAGVLLLQMLLAPDKFCLWSRLGGVLAPLPFACAAVYLLSMLAGLILLMPERLTGYTTAAVVMLYGATVLNLTRVLVAVYREYPQAAREAGKQGGLAFDKTMLLLLAMFMLLIGMLLFPVSVGMIPFSPSAQLGLLMVINALQIIAAGNTPIGSFSRSRLVTMVGMLFATLGIVSCIVPGILVTPLAMLIGVTNIANGGLSLRQSIPAFVAFNKNRREHSLPSILLKLYVVQIAMGVLAVMFGSSMLVPGVIPGTVIGGLLAANGAVLIYLIRVLFQVEAHQERKSQG